MGFDNECIINIQSLAGEYFCPVCRTLVYPHEALQTQCTHLYCKPCLTYVVSSTQACPYDGYLVTEAGSKPLMESNKALGETIGKTIVHCLYHRSGCMWQGPLSDCTTHCSGCAFGNSPVVCNRCGIQIVHRQVQEHAQTCNVNGTNTQPQQGSETAQDPAVSGAADQSKIGNQVAAPASNQPHASHTATTPSSAQNSNQPATANPVVPPATAVPTPEQWYQQQYQQYYQQYPDYDPYQQQAYQQYYPYQQQPAQQFQQPPLQVQAQPQPQSQPQLQQQIQAPMQLQPQVQPQPVQPQIQNSQAQGHSHSQAQTHSQAQPQIPSNGQPQPLYPQAAVVGSNQSQGQVNPQQQTHSGGQQPHVPIQSQNQPLARGQMPLQSYSQAQPQPVQNHAQPHMQVPQYQQPHPQMHHSQPPQVHPHLQTQSQPQPQSHPQAHPHFQPHPQPQPQPINPQHPPVQSMAGHPSYPSQPHQQIQHAPSQQHPMQVQPSIGSLPPGQMPVQFPQPPPHMRPTQPLPHMLPSQGQTPGIPPTQHIYPHNQPHQRPVVPQVQQPMPHQYVQQPQAFAGQASAGPFVQQVCPPQPMQQPPLGFVQPQQGTALPHGMPPHSSQSYGGRPAMLNQSQQFPQSSGIGPHARPPQFVPSQPSVNQSNVNMTNQPHVYSEQHNQYMPPPLGGAVVDRKGDQTFERRAEQQEDKSPSLKKSEPVANDFGSNFNEVKPDTGMNDEGKPGGGGEDDHRKDEALSKDAVPELHQVQGDSVNAQRVKEESEDGVVVHSPCGKLSHNKAENVGVATIDSVKQGDSSVNFQGSSDVDNGSLVPPGSSLNGIQHDRTLNQSQTTPQRQFGDVSGGFPSKGTEQSPHPAPLTDQGRSSHPPVPYAFSGQQQRPAAPSSLQSAPPTGQTLGQPPNHIRPSGHGYLPHPEQPEHFQPPGPNQPGPFHPEYPMGGLPVPGSASTFSNSRGYEPHSAGSHGQYNQGQIPQSSHARPSRMSHGEPFSSAPLPHGPDGQTVPRHPGPMKTDMYQNQRPPQFDSRRPDSHFPGTLDRGLYSQSFGVESNSMRMNGAPAQGHDLTSVPIFRDENFRTPAGMHPDSFSMGPSRHPEQSEFKGALKQFPGPPHLGNEESLKFSSRPLGGYGMDGPSRFFDKDPHGYGYDAGQRVDPGTGGPPSAFLPPYHSSGSLHPNESGGRPLPASMHDENRGRFDNNRQNLDFLAPMHGFSRHHMDRLPPGSPGNPSRSFDVDGREMERRPFGERFPMVPPGHMHIGEFDGPGKLRSGERGEPFGLRNLSGHPHVGEPGFGSFQDYGRSGESNGPGGFSHQQSFGEPFGPKSTRPHLGEPGFRSSYSHQGFPSDGGFYAGGSDSFDPLRKRKSFSMGWCRICKVDCESVEGLDIHGQTREHQRIAMDMVISIKQTSAKKQKTSNDHSAREEASKLRNAEIHARVI